MSQLTAKQSSFVAEYLKDLNATQAAIRAGYSEKTAGQIGEQNLKKLEIKKAIDLAMQERSKRTQIDADWLLRRLADEVEADIADIFDATTGSIKPIDKWPLIFRQGLVAGIDVNQLNVDGKAIGEAVKIKLADRNAKLKMIGDHIGVQAFKQQLEHKHSHAFEELSEKQLDERIAELSRKAGASKAS